MNGFQYVDAADVRRTPLRVAISPVPSLSAAIRDAAGASRAGTPPGLRAAIRAHLRSADFETLAPMLSDGPMLIPDALLGLAAPPGERFAEGVERIIATPVDEILSEITGSCTNSGAGGWRVAERDAARWLRRYVAALLRAWKAFGPVWADARPALDAEIERVGQASAMDAQLELLEGLLPDTAIGEGGWYLSCSIWSGRTYLPDEGLVLMPLIGGPTAKLVAKRDGVITTIGYPARRARGGARGAPGGPALESLLGIPRARVLRSLTAPTSIGRLAEMLRAVPSAATHHVDALEAAGLVERDRRGRTVLVQRTERGEHLLALYDDVAARRAARRGAGVGYLRAVGDRGA